MILVVVFAFGLAAGVGVMVWAWPGLRAHFFPHHREGFVPYMTRTLKLTPQQVPQLQALAKEITERRHQLHLQFVPAYTKVCNDFTQVQKQERDAYAPIRQQEVDKFHAMLTSAQWQAFQQQRAQASRNRPPRQTDLCRHLAAAPGAAPPPPPPNGAAHPR